MGIPIEVAQRPTVCVIDSPDDRRSRDGEIAIKISEREIRNQRQDEEYAR